MNYSLENIVRPPDQAQIPFKLKSKTGGLIPKGLTLLAVLIIVAILAIIMANAFYGGAGIISWKFISQPPEQGMTAGGIFPAIFGTVALVILMVIFGNVVYLLSMRQKKAIKFQ